MSSNPRTVLMTAGTSLLANARRNAGSDTLMATVRDALERGDAAAAARAMRGLTPNDPRCGAEVNSLHYLKERKKLPIGAVHLLVSDSDDGRCVGKTICRYLQERDEFDLRQADSLPIIALDERDPGMFAGQGLRNLVRTIGRLVRREGAEQTIIDATGGYKAQTAIAVVVGQMLGVPVTYRFQQFETIIEFPALPVSFDVDLLARHMGSFVALERENMLPEADIEPLPSALRVFLERETIDGRKYVGLAPLGQVMLETLRTRVRPHHNPRPIPDSERRSPSFRDDHYPTGFKEHVQRIFEREPWIKHTYTISYGKQKGIKGTSFRVRELDGPVFRLEGEYLDTNGFGGRFVIQTADPAPTALQAAALYLNEMYGPP